MENVEAEGRSHEGPGESLAFTRRLVGRTLAVAAATAAVALPVDTALLLWHGTGLRAALACGIASASLGCFLALVVGPAVLIITVGADRIRRSRSFVRWLWPVPVAATAWLVAAVSTGALLYYKHPRDTVVIGGFTVLVVLAAAVSRVRRRIALALSTFAIAALCATDIVLQTSLGDPHDLLAFATVAWVLAAAAPIRARLERAKIAPLVWALGLALLASGAAIAVVDRAAPGWRVRSWQSGRYQERLERASRALVDFDADGFSPVAWGGDCNDLDPTRNPYAHERPGVIDANCNGVTPSANPTDDDRGLAPAAGTPTLAPGAVSRVLLITIDCARVDVLRRDVMPELSRFAARGITFDRLYAGATRTAGSLPLMMRGTANAKPVSAILAAKSIPSTAIMSWREDEKSVAVLQDFPNIQLPETNTRRWDAEETTEHTLAALREGRGSPSFVWVHYFDAHANIQLEPPASAVPFPVPAGLDPTFSLYLYALNHIDHQLGRIFEELETSGELARTVVIVTSDHGEGFGRHGVMFHAVSGYEAITHVPGVLVAPGLAPGSYAGLATHRDILPTILGAFGLADSTRDAEVFARSWLRIGDAKTAPLHRFVVVQSMRDVRVAERIAPMGAIVDANLKLIETFEDGLLEMYDPIADPLEENDLVPGDSTDVTRLRHEMALFRDLDRWP